MKKFPILLIAVAIFSVSCAESMPVYQPASLSPMPAVEVNAAPYGASAAQQAVRRSLEEYLDKLRVVNGLYMVKIYPRLSQIATEEQAGNYRALGSIFSKTAASNAKWRVACESFVQSAVYLDFYASLLPPGNLRNSIKQLIDHGERFGHQTILYSNALDLFMNTSAEYSFDMDRDNYDTYVQQNRQYYAYLLDAMPKLGGRFSSAWNALIPLMAKTKNSLSNQTLSKN